MAREYGKRGRSIEAARLARETRQAVAEVKAADHERRRIGWQPDLFGADELELVAPRRPLPSTWGADMRAYHRAELLGDRS